MLCRVMVLALGLVLAACPNLPPPGPEPTPALFPDPVRDAGVPAGAEEVFDRAPSPGGPCLLAPELGALIPRNFSAPRVVFEAPAGHNLFQVELRIPGESVPYRFITTRRDFVLPEQDWSLAREASIGQEVIVRVLSAQVDLSTLAVQDGPSAGSEGTITIGDVSAKGTLLYWTVDGDLDFGRTFFMATVAGANRSNVLYDSDANGGRCIGCHTSSPDGEFLALTAGNPGPPDFSMDVVRINSLSLSPFPGLLPAARAVLDRIESTIPVFSAAHFTDDDQRVVYVNNRALASLNLLTGEQGTIATGDPRAQAMPTWSPDGESVVYVSTDGELDGRTTSAPCDLFAVPYNDGQGGTATPVVGASRADRQEYYPAFSPDGELLAFNTSASETFDARDAEVHLLSNGDDLRLRANDTPACSPFQSPGLTNSWPKWSPIAEPFDGGTLYFLTFSSRRLDGALPQIFVAPIVVTAEGALREFPALLLPGQDPGVGNHTPSWNPLPIE